MADKPAQPEPGGEESPALFSEGGGIDPHRDFDAAQGEDTPASQREQESQDAMRRLITGKRKRRAESNRASAAPVSRSARGRATSPPAAPHLQDPPARRQGIIAWLAMLLCMAAAAPAVLIDLYYPEVTDAEEARALAISIHTWTRLNAPQASGENLIESLVPRYNGRKQWRESPGVTWTQMFAFENLSPKPLKSQRIEVVIDGKGRLAPQPPFDPVDAASQTAAQVIETLRKQAEARKLLDVRIRLGQLLPPEPVKPGGADREAVERKSASFDEKRLLAVGDEVRLWITYAEPHWRAEVQTIPLIKHARLCSAILGLITIAAVFWAGHSIAGIRAGLFSALVCAANPVFIWHARLASPPIHQAMWAMLSIAAALWAIRPLRASPTIERQFLGWVVCGLSLGGATLTTGPLVIVTVMGPILLLLLLCPHRRGHLMGLMAAVIIGVLVVLPWTVKLYEGDPEAPAIWWRDHQPFGFQTLTLLFDHFGQRLLLVLAALLPWSIWLAAAIAQPFSTSSTGSRTRLFLGFTWFLAATLIMLMLPASSDIGALLPLVPAAAVMIGQLFHHYTDLAAEARYARFWRILRWPHILLLAWVSVLAPMVIAMPQPFIDKGWFSSPFFYNWGTTPSVLLGIVLLLVVGLAGRMAYKQYPGGTLAYTAVWMLLLAAVIAIPASKSDHARSMVRKDAETIARHAQDRPVFVVQGEAFSPGEIEPTVLLYAGCEIRQIAAKQIDDVAAKQKTTIFLLSRADAAKPADKAQRVAELTRTRTPMQLWKVGQDPEKVAQP
jgi:4-amino-4-deoxy-L-arabinose transferase-like glycosyltransferase